ncbi:MAG TPA: hypothetical protein VN042_11385 [Asticcacaulis sp.]|nr:hypothetical protein [Asticcacaulis sp.]
MWLMLALPVAVVCVCVICLFVMILRALRPRREIETFVFRRLRDDDRV